MKRYAAVVQVILAILVVLASTPRIQAASKLPRVGMLCAPACSGPNFDAFWEGLRKLGWVEGTTVVIDRKEAGSRLDELPILATHLVQSQPDLIVTLSPQAARAVKDATSEIPIVMIFIADPVGMGLASSLAHPGGNATGVDREIARPRCPIVASCPGGRGDRIALARLPRTFATCGRTRECLFIGDGAEVIATP